MFEPMAGLAAKDRITIQVDGRSLQVRKGISLAMALMEANVVPLRRTPLSHAPRSPLCLMGVCFECLCHVDGRQNIQSCMVEVVDGMNVRLANGARRVEAVRDA
ncbi:(2Fe-2S)-binding protein [Bosea sp. (in: a-proteobacteria)]|jgi:predicted molibdopterin-dependent oxidoreductase YjgC|uniref:(2Fe-2S)-binding protein n=1 Tax=Bosea sp. (in: a-proteobacteria) TaxID=1871050 RepID=UPI002DDCB129|nr:(2Fe-2S)-binding protein [Bosea sp. (in: a-proteobacteria)]HEV2508311.1 (2Fe-2S)-binding protein [Bosea sp. (in: a-proteobacteria)]